MLRILIVLFLFGSFSAHAAVNTAPMVLDEDIVLDDAVIEGSTETESYILSDADEAFLKLDDETLLAEAREAKYQAFRDRDMSLDVYHEILDAFEDITEDVEFDAEDEDFLNAGIKLPVGKKEAKASIDSVKSQKK